MNEKIKVPLPLSNRQADEIQDTITANEENIEFLKQSRYALEQKTEEAGRLGLYENASTLADLLRITSMAIDDLESQEQDNY